MGGPPDFGGFADVDRTGVAPDYAAYLDGVGDIAAVAEWKERSLAALEPRPGARLVDLGCGTGRDALALARRVAPGGRVIGVDASAAMAAEARRRAAEAGLGDAVEIFGGDARRLDLAMASVDGARCERLLQHLDDPAAAVAEMARVVRPRGRVVVAEPDWGTLVLDAGDPEAARAVAAAAGAPMRCPTAGRAVRRLLVEAGLAGVEVVARTLVLTDLARAQAVLDLAGAARRARAGGALTAEEARAWGAALERAEAEGRFLAAMTAFMAWGRRP